MSCFVQTYIPTTLKLEDNMLQTAGASILNALSMSISVKGNDISKCNIEPHGYELYSSFGNQQYLV